MSPDPRRDSPLPDSPPRDSPPGDSPPPRVLVRDLVIFQLKLALDGAKDLVLSALSIGATVLDIAVGPGPNGPRLYTVLRIGERFDLWLSLYGPAEAARDSEEGLYGGSRAGSDTLLGRIEEWSRGGPEPEEPAEHGDVGPSADAPGRRDRKPGESR